MPRALNGGFNDSLESELGVRVVTSQQAFLWDICARLVTWIHRMSKGGRKVDRVIMIMNFIMSMNIDDDISFRSRLRTRRPRELKSPCSGDVNVEEHDGA